jgi:hypothetical protein
MLKRSAIAVTVVASMCVAATGAQALGLRVFDQHLNHRGSPPSAFVGPSAVNQGDVIALDASMGPRQLGVPATSYRWSFGDGTTAVGPSVEHAYAQARTRTVKLEVTGRAGSVSGYTQTVQVLRSQVARASTASDSATGVAAGTNSSQPALQVRLLLMPQSLAGVLRSGLAARVTSNQTVAGFAFVSISPAAAKRAHIDAGRGPSVVIGRGTISRVGAGTATMRLHLANVTVAKLKPLAHVTLTVRLALVAATGDQLAIDTAGQY